MKPEEAVEMMFETALEALVDLHPAEALKSQVDAAFKRKADRVADLAADAKFGPAPE